MAPVIDEVVRTGVLPKKTTRSYEVLRTFTFLQAGRTEEAATALNNAVNANKDVGDVLAKQHQLRSEERETERKSTALYTIYGHLKALEHTRDLHCKLLINEGDKTFLTSDHPVVRYNQWAERLKMLVPQNGLGSKGLQLFLPLSPVHILCYYDGAFYRVGDKRKDVIRISDSRDIAQLNMLQILNAGSVVFHNGTFTEPELQLLHSQTLAKTRSKEPISLTQQTGPDSYLNVVIGHAHSIHLDISFIRETDKAKQFNPSGWLVELRNESLRGGLRNPRLSIRPPRSK